MRTPRLLLALALTGLPAAEAGAATIDYSATFDTVVDNFFPTGLGGGTHWTYLLLSGSTPELTGTLTAGQQLRITYSAPAGQQINILPKPASAQSLFVSAVFWSDSPQSSPFVHTPGASFSFTGLAGAPPAVSAFDFIEAASGRFRTALTFDTGGFSFQSLDMLFDVPATYDRTFVNHVPSDVFLLVIADWTTGIFDPGPLITVTRAPAAAPEPAAGLLTALALGAATLVRRRPATGPGSARRSS